MWIVNQGSIVDNYLKIFFLCPGWESNPYPLRDTILSGARIPVPPPRHYDFFVRPEAESNRRIELLQSSALPLGHQVLSRNFSFDLKARQFVDGCVHLNQFQNQYEGYEEYESCLE